jgi:hypothetical protein
MALIKATWDDCVRSRAEFRCGKACYGDAHAAAVAMADTVRRTSKRDRVNVYYCECCTAYHWGHVPISVRRQVRRREFA